MKTRFVNGRSLATWGLLSCLSGLVVLSLGGCPPVNNGGGTTSSLTGTWSGDVDYVLRTTLGSDTIGTTNETLATTVVFDDSGTPDKVIVPLLESPAVLAEVPLTDLTQVGDTTTVTVDEQGEQKSATFTVVEVNNADTEYGLTLDVSYQSGLLDQPLVGTYNLSAVLQDDGTLAWDTQANLAIRQRLAGHRHGQHLVAAH